MCLALTLSSPFVFFRFPFYLFTLRWKVGSLITHLAYTRTERESRLLVARPVLNAGPGGELFGHIAQLETYTEDYIQRFVRELLVAVKHLHSLNIILKRLRVSR